ncbi:unnamed protein product [Gulo gulo]|uniref:Uncharacterized protein n=1 Tax=Gulo gulo TaxID=48420 RepID=A0A9X9M6X1_GULGU|nr:unnamed protein product [Gulo gulo]
MPVRTQVPPVCALGQLGGRPSLSSYISHMGKVRSGKKKPAPTVTQQITRAGTQGCRWPSSLGWVGKK